MEIERQKELENIIKIYNYAGLIGVGNNTLTTSRFEYSEEMLRSAESQGFGHVVPFEPTIEEKDKIVKILCDRDGKTEQQARTEVEYMVAINNKSVLFYDRTGELSKEMCSEIINQFYCNYQSTELGGLFGVDENSITIPSNVEHYEELVTLLQQIGFNVKMTPNGVEVAFEKNMVL